MIQIFIIFDRNWTFFEDDYEIFGGGNLEFQV